jgi:general secretion pathway protein D
MSHLQLTDGTESPNSGWMSWTTWPRPADISEKTAGLAARASYGQTANHIRLFAALALGLSLAACGAPGDVVAVQVLDQPTRISSRVVASNNEGAKGGLMVSVDEAEPPTRNPVIVRGEMAAPAKGEVRTGPRTPGTYLLNFDNADVRDVVKAVMGDMLGTNYVIDPGVKGTLTLNTSQPLGREAVMPALEEALKLTEATIVSSPTGYQVVPLKGAAQRAAVGIVGSAFRPGFQVRVVPLRYVTAGDVQRVLEPIVSPGTIVQGDPRAGIVTLAGTQAEILRAEQAIATFDVDWMRSQSFGLFPLKFSTANDVAEDLNAVIGKDGGLAGAVRIAPIAHMNAILVVSKALGHVERMRAWIDRFDRGRDVLKPRMFVYHVQNGRAQDLAAVLTKVFSPSRGTAGAGSDNAGAEGTPTAPGISSQFPQSAGVVQAGLASAQPSPFGALPTRDGMAAAAGGQQAGLQITADEVNNALVIVTIPSRYSQVEAALAQLDKPPLQVMIEASIIEVEINDRFKYGVQTAFQKRGLSLLDASSPASALASSAGGLSAALLRSNIEVTLDLLSTLTNIHVISAPKLMVLNNRSASIQIGDQVPVATSSAVSTITANAPTVNTIQLVDTGIILHITPRVNRSGLVYMDLSQEVSASVPTVTSNIDSPTIQQRRVATSVAVQDAQTIAIGGLIHDSRDLSRTGVPFLKDLPTVGGLFGVNGDARDRTELMVLLTPHVIGSAEEANEVTDELSAKLPLLKGMRGASAR